MQISVIIFHVVLQISVLIVVDNEIIFNVILEITVVSVDDDEIVFNMALQISAVSVVNDEFIFNVVLQMSVVGVVNEVMKTIQACLFHFYEKISRTQKRQNAKEVTFTLLKVCARKKLLPLLFSVSLILFC